MKVSEKDVLYVSELANLELTAEERLRMVRDLNSILDYIDRLNELDTGNVPPMAQISDRYAAEGKPGSGKFAYAFRPDASGGSLSRQAALENAPEASQEFFRVPKVIERQ